MQSFDHLGLSAPILKTIGQLGFENPTDIQNKAIPRLLEGDCDFIGLAQTGTGKTAAFGLPLLEHLDASEDHVQALILAPTRELGQQIAQQITLFAQNLKGIKTVAVYGGANISEQIRQLRTPRHVVIATPGRLIDLVKRKALRLDKIKYLVLDEADEMLNMGFKEELDTILEFTPATKHTWLFSATMPREIRRMVNQYMESPFEVSIDPKTAVNANIEHRYALVRHTDKTEALARFLDLETELYGVVFCRTRLDTQSLAENLMKLGFRADALHGELSQAQRDRVMQRFKNRELQVLIATDVAARGIDVNDLTHVFHHSLPAEQAYYTHRSGRTARAGKTGISLAFINKKEKAHINRISRGLEISFEQIQVPDADQIVKSRLMNWANNLLNQKPTDRTPAEMLEQINLLFDETSKEELLARMVTSELARLNVGSGTDLNKKADQEPEKPYRDRSGRGGGGYSGGGYSGGGYSGGGYGKSSGSRRPERSEAGGYDKSRGSSGGYDKPRGARRTEGAGGSSGGYDKPRGARRTEGAGGSSGGYDKPSGTRKPDGAGSSSGGYRKSSGSTEKFTGFGSSNNSGKPGNFRKRKDENGGRSKFGKKPFKPD